MYACKQEASYGKRLLALIWFIWGIKGGVLFCLYKPLCYRIILIVITSSYDFNLKHRKENIWILCNVTSRLPTSEGIAHVTEVRGLQQCDIS